MIVALLLLAAACSSEPVASQAADAATSAPTAAASEIDPLDAFPDASSTGVPDDVTLQPSESLVVTEPGAVIEGLDVSGCIEVQADDVTIRNTRVRGSCPQGAISTGYGELSGILIEDVEVDGLRQDSFTAGIGGSGFTCRRCDVHDSGQGINMGRDVVVEDSYVHDLYYADDSHNAAVSSNGGGGYVIRGNRLEIPPSPGASAALALYGDFAPIEDVLVEGNRFDGGSYCVYGGSVEGKPYPEGRDIRFIDNVFGDTFHADCGMHGPYVAFDHDAPGNEWRGNRLAATGQLLD